MMRRFGLGSGRSGLGRGGLAVAALAAAFVVALAGAARTEATPAPTLVVDGVVHQYMALGSPEANAGMGWLYSESCTVNVDGTLDVTFSASSSNVNAGATLQAVNPLAVRLGTGSVSGTANIDVASANNPRNFSGSFSFDFGSGTTIAGTFWSDPAAPTEGTVSGSGVYGFCNPPQVSSVRTPYLLYSATITDADGTRTDQGTAQISMYASTSCRRDSCTVFIVGFTSVAPVTGLSD